MNIVDFQEKMDPTHRMYLCRMLNVKNLSEDLLGRYAQVKMLVDRIDGHLTPGDLAMIIVSVGDNPEIATELLEESDDEVIEEAVEKPVTTVRSDRLAFVEPPVEQPVEDVMVETVRETMAKDIEQPVSGATGQAAEQPTPELGKLWAQGMPVKVLIEDELKEGKIFSVHPLGEGNEQVQLTVSLEDGTTVTVNEDEVDAV